MSENKKMMEYKLPMYDITVKGNVYGIAQLSAKFQIWCRQYRLTDEESLAIWLAGGPEHEVMTAKEALQIATEASKKLPAVTVINVD